MRYLRHPALGFWLAAALLGLAVTAVALVAGAGKRSEVPFDTSPGTADRVVTVRAALPEGTRLFGAAAVAADPAAWSRLAGWADQMAGTARASAGADPAHASQWERLSVDATGLSKDASVLAARKPLELAKGTVVQLPVSSLPSPAELAPPERWPAADLDATETALAAVAADADALSGAL